MICFIYRRLCKTPVLETVLSTLQTQQPTCGRARLSSKLALSIPRWVRLGVLSESCDCADEGNLPLLHNQAKLLWALNGVIWWGISPLSNREWRWSPFSLPPATLAFRDQWLWRLLEHPPVRDASVSSPRGPIRASSACETGELDGETMTVREAG